jgi:nitroimidazol reductase NimA-like FMN-containing flavoprotein (pyridoxamine 5'-phosphate oxidase superfamily)
VERNQIDTVIKKSVICRLAMLDGDRPYVVPLNFGYADNALYFHGSPKSRKIALLRSNPNVCVEFDLVDGTKEADAPCRWSVKARSVIGFGKAVLIESVEEKIKALGIIMAQYSDRPFDFPEKELNATAVFKIDLEQLTGKEKGYE